MNCVSFLLVGSTCPNIAYIYVQKSKQEILRVRRNKFGVSSLPGRCSPTAKLIEIPDILSCVSLQYAKVDSRSGGNQFKMSISIQRRKNKLSKPFTLSAGTSKAVHVTKDPRSRLPWEFPSRFTKFYVCLQ